MSQPEGTRVRSEEIVCPGGMPAFMALPRAAAGRLPVVVLMHERYGLVQHTRDLTMRCASDGYLAIAPNFFFKHPDQASLNKGDSSYPLGDHPNADLSRVVVAGYCQTGRFPIVFGAEEAIVGAVVWYGGAAPREWPVTEKQPRPFEKVMADLRCPVFGAFATLDHVISLDDVRRFRNALEDAGKSYEVYVYEKAPHGWLNDTMPGRYRKTEAEAAWAAQQRFIAKVTMPGFKPSNVSWHFECARPFDYDYTKNVRME
jgi:carboxymethylenebutenolidase